MKILFIGCHFPRPNNPEIGTWALSQMKALQNLGHDVRVISPVPAVPKFISKLLRRGSSSACPPTHSWNGLDAYYVRWCVYPVGPLSKLLESYPNLLVPIGWWFSSRQFINASKDFRPDVIFAHHAVMGGYVAKHLSDRFNCPYVITEHSFEEIETCATYSGRRALYRSVTKRVSRWLAVSTRMEATMKELFPSVRSRTLANGADRNDQSAEGAGKSASVTSINRNERVFLCVGFFYKRKNVPLLIRAFDRIAGNHPDAVLRIVGDGEDLAHVTEARSRANHPNQIELLGRKDHQTILSLMRNSFAFVLIAENEPFGVVYCEAMLAGLPIIFCSDAGISDLAKTGIHGIAVKPNDLVSAADAMEFLLGNPDRTSEMGKSSKELAERQLTWRHNAEQLEEILAQSVGSGTALASSPTRNLR